MSDRPVIALRIESAAEESRWRQLLTDVNCRVLGSEELSTTDLTIDILVTDGRRNLNRTELTPAATAFQAVVGIGAAEGDVVFADDPTERELRLACDLLYRIVLLERERAASRQTQQWLEQLVERDALTELANRRAWDAELARRMQTVPEDTTSLCLALFDLDHFKQINTVHGYPVADQVLRQVGSTLKNGVRADDLVARIGGDEFGVLLSNVSADTADAVVERIRASIAPALRHSGLPAVTATAGLAVRNTGDAAETLFAAADTNLRHGKSAGRNQTVASS